MTSLKRNWVRVAALGAALTMVACGSDDDAPGSPTPSMQKSRVRVIHASYDAPAVDVAVDGAKAIAGLAFGKASGYAELDAGERAVMVMPSGDSTALIDTKLVLEADADYSILAVNIASKLEAIVAKDMRSPSSSKAKIRFIHASPDAPAVDIKIGSGDGPAAFSNIAFKKVSDYIEVDAGDYAFVVTAAGSTDAVISYKAVGLEAGQVYTAMALGTLSADDSYDFTARVFVDNGEGKASLDLEPAPATPPTTAGKARVRVVHGSYNAPAVDISVDGSKAITDLGFGESSGYAELDAGKRSVAVTPSAGGDAVIAADLELMKDKEYTIFALNDVAKIEPLVALDDRASNPDKARVRFLHGSPDAPAVDIRVGAADGPALFADASFKDITKYAEVDEGTYTLVVTPAGETTAVITFDNVALSKGMVLTVAALGTLAADDPYDFFARAFIDTDAGKTSVDLEPMGSSTTSRAMVVHASPDAPAVDLLLDGTKVNMSALSFPSNTGYLDIEAGERRIEVRPAGSSTAVIDATLTLEADKNYSIFAIDTVANIAPLVLEDDLTAPMAGMAHVRFIHLSPDAPAVDIFPAGGSAALFANQSFKDATAFTPVGAGKVTLEVRVAGTSNVALTVPDVELMAGKIYTVFAKGLLGNGSLGAELIANN